MSTLVALDAVNPPGARSHDCSIDNLPGQEKILPRDVTGCWKASIRPSAKAYGVLESAAHPGIC